MTSSDVDLPPKLASDPVHGGGQSDCDQEEEALTGVLANNSASCRTRTKAGWCWGWIGLSRRRNRTIIVTMNLKKWCREVYSKATTPGVEIRPTLLCTVVSHSH
jgi:hypothetical protein